MNIDNVLAHAQQLMMNKGFWDKVDASTPGAPSGGVKSRESKMFENVDNGQPVQYLQFKPEAPKQIDPNNTKIDRRILESFQKMPSQSAVLNPEISNLGDYAGDIPASFLTGLNGGGNTQPQGTGNKQLPNIQYNKNWQHQQQQPQIVNEQTQYTQQPSAAVDYNYIKYLIDESLKNYF